MKKLIGGLLSLLLLTGCAQTNPATLTTNPTADRLQVMTSFNPIDQLVRTIGGDRVETTIFVDPGVDAHDFEPSARDMARLKEADVLFINGLGMEPWAEDGAIGGATKLMILGDGLDYIPLADDHVGEEPDPDHAHEGVDPHVWLGLTELRIMAENTATALEIAAPEHADYFKANLAAFLAQADALTAEFNPRFAPYRGQAFVTGHEAFGYLTRNIGLIQRAVEGPFAEGEPTPQKIRELVDYVRDQGITTIFVEETASPKVSETLARETGASLVQIPTMETAGELLPTIREIYEKVLTSLETK